jgi:ADP-heptose:LPS heptosyltransferase
MVLISPFARNLRSGKPSPKNYPFWKEIVHILRRDLIEVVQIGRTGEEDLGANFKMFNLPFKEIRALIDKCDLWISVDNFLQHMIGPNGKKGIVIFGPSNPIIFGYPNNVNLFKDISGFRKDQFALYEGCPFVNFPEPNIVIDTILKELKERG